MTAFYCEAAKNKNHESPVLPLFNRSYCYGKDLSCRCGWASVVLVGPGFRKTVFYIAPKILLNMQHTEANHRLDQHEVSYSGIGFSDTTDTIAGFAVAADYDFTHKFNVPFLV